MFIVQSKSLSKLAQKLPVLIILGEKKLSLF